MVFSKKQVNVSESYPNAEISGNFSWTDGSTYVGEFRDGRPHGFGTYTWPDGDKYTGFWVAGKRHGLGFHSRLNGFVYIGNFVDNMPHGEGSSVDARGNSYSGTWEAGFQNGEGFIRGGKEGIMFFGKWCHGKPVFRVKP